MCPRPPSPRTPKRQDVRVLDQQEQVVDLGPLPLFDQRALERERLGVGSAAQVADLDESGHLVN